MGHSVPPQRKIVREEPKKIGFHITSRLLSRNQRSPNISTEALTGHPERRWAGHPRHTATVAYCLHVGSELGKLLVVCKEARRRLSRVENYCRRSCSSHRDHSRFRCHKTGHI